MPSRESAALKGLRRTLLVSALAGLMAAGGALAEEGKTALELNPYCTEASSEPQCRWSSEQLQASEQELARREVRRLEDLVLKHLSKASWRPVNALVHEEEEERGRQYCEKVLTSLRERKFTPFPSPDMASSKVGVRAVAAAALRHMPNDEECERERAVRKAMMEGKILHGMLPLAGNSFWFYASDRGFALVSFVHAAGRLRIAAVVDHCRVTTGYIGPGLERKIENVSGGDWEFAQLAYALVKTDEGLLAVLGGKMWMRQFPILWPDLPWLPLIDAHVQHLRKQGRQLPDLDTIETLSEREVQDLQGRVLIAFPLDKPWFPKERPNDDDAYAYEVPPGVTPGPCLWNMHD